MKEIYPLSLLPVRPVSLGDFLHGRISVRTPTPIGLDGRWTDRSGSLAARGAALSRREYRGSGGAIRKACRASVRLGSNSYGVMMRWHYEGKFSLAFHRLPAMDGQHDCPAGRAG